jgi:hypothetical protein
LYLHFDTTGCLKLTSNEICHVLQVGFDAGDGVNYFALPASRTSEIINVTSMSNVNIPGLFMFRVDSAGIKQGGCNTNGKVCKFSGRVFQQTVGIPMGTNCPPLLTDLFLYSYEADFIQGLLKKNEKKLA